jgi:hypothetical protein
MDHRDAEAQLQRELDESHPRDRFEPPRRGYRVLYTLPVVIIVAATGAVLAYLITTLVVETHTSPAVAYAASAAVIFIVAWGTTGISRTYTTLADRFVDLAVCLIVGWLVHRLVQPTPVFELFESPKGLGAAPRFYEVATWSAVWACASVALCSFVRLALRR